MYLKKVIKYYFIFVMTVSLSAAAMTNDNVNQYVVSVLHVGEASLGADISQASIKQPFQIDMNSIVEKNLESYPKYLTGKDNPEGVLIDMDLYMDKSFAFPADKSVPVMGFEMGANEEELVMKGVKVKIAGIAPEKITGGGLIMGEKAYEAEKDGEYLVFKNMNLKVDKGMINSAVMVVDISDEAKSGDRFRIEIPGYEDIQIFVGSEKFQVTNYYPIKSGYITIANPVLKHDVSE